MGQRFSGSFSRQRATARARSSGYVRPPLPQIGRRLGDLLHQDPGDRGGIEGQLPGQHLVGHDAEAVEIGAAVDVPLAGCLLRAHEGRRPDGYPDTGSVAPEVDDSALAIPKSVTMTRPRVPSSRMLSGLMSRWMTESAWAALSASAVSFMMRRTSSTGSWSPPADPGGHRLAVHVSHDEIHQPLALADGVNRDDVGMGQPGGGLGLPGEPLPDVLLKGKLGRKHLDGHPALKPLVSGAVHHAHPAPPDLAFDGIGSPRLRRGGRAAAWSSESRHRAAALAQWKEA